MRARLIFIKSKLLPFLAVIPIVILYLVLISPTHILSFVGFYILVALTAWLFYRLFVSKLSGIFYTLATTIFFVLAQLHLLDPLTTVLFVLVIITVTIYLRSN